MGENFKTQTKETEAMTLYNVNLCSTYRKRVDSKWSDGVTLITNLAIDADKTRQTDRQTDRETDTQQPTKEQRYRGID